jgi:hypothetical protein
LDFHDATNWYDVPTGVFHPGITIAHNDTGKPRTHTAAGRCDQGHTIVQQAIKPQPPQMPDGRRNVRAGADPESISRNELAKG